MKCPQVLKKSAATSQKMLTAYSLVQTPLIGLASALHFCSRITTGHLYPNKTFSDTKNPCLKTVENLN